MARVNNISTLLQGLRAVPDLARFTADAFNSLLTQFNGNLDFGDNIRTSGPIAVEFSNTLPTKINHGLGRIPQGFFVTYLDRAAIIYTPNKSQFPWTDSQIYAQSNTSSAVANLLIF